MPPLTAAAVSKWVCMLLIFITLAAYAQMRFSRGVGWRDAVWDTIISFFFFLSERVRSFVWRRAAAGIIDMHFPRAGRLPSAVAAPETRDVTHRGWVHPWNSKDPPKDIGVRWNRERREKNTAGNTHDTQTPIKGSTFETKNVESRIWSEVVVRIIVFEFRRERDLKVVLGMVQPVLWSFPNDLFGQAV